VRRFDGSSLDAAVRVERHERLEQLCRCVTRLALADERVQLNAAGHVGLKLKTPRREGTIDLIMSPPRERQVAHSRRICHRCAILRRVGDGKYEL